MSDPLNNFDPIGREPSQDEESTMTTHTQKKIIEVLEPILKHYLWPLKFEATGNACVDAITDAILEQFPCTHEPKWIAWQSQPGDVYCHTCGKRKESGGE